MATSKYSPRARRRRKLFALLSLLGGVALALAVALGAWHAGAFPTRWYDEFREVRVVGRAEARPFRILALGDSFLQKWPLKRHLRRDLFVYADERDLGLVVVSMGGWGPFDYRAAMGQMTNTKFLPTLVVVFYHVGNDVTDTIRVLSTPLPEHLREGGSGGAPPPTHPPAGMPPNPSYPSPFVKQPGAPGPQKQLFLPLSCGFDDELKHPVPPEPKEEDYNWKQMRQNGIDAELIKDARRSLRDGKVGHKMVSATLLSSAVANPTLFTQNVLINDEMSQKAWKMAQAQLKWLFDLARMSGADIALVIIPSMVQVSRAQEPFLRRARFKIDQKMFSSTRPQRLLRSFCFDHKVMALDLLPFLKKHPNKQQLYWKKDDHLSQLGNQVVFEIIQKRLLDPWYKNKQRSPKDRERERREPPKPPGR